MHYFGTLFYGEKYKKPMSYKIFVVLLLCLACSQINGQQPGDKYRFENAEVYNGDEKDAALKKLPPAWRAFEAARASIVLAQNEDHLIPVRELENKRIAYLPIGLPEGGEFERFLKKYSRVDRIVPPAINKGKTAMDWAAELKKKYNLIILGIEDRTNQQKAYFNQHFAINSVIQEFPNVTVVFGGNQIFKFLPTIKDSEALMVVPDQFELVESIAAQAVFGGVGLDRELWTYLGTGMNEGKGVSTLPDSVFRYGPPVMVDMDAQLLEDSIRSIVEEGIRARAYPGAQVLVARKGQVVYHETFGYHTYDSIRAVREDDVYDFASVTKVSSALPALMKLYGEGRFELDAPLKQYVPKFKRSNKADLSFRSMLAHNARLKPWIPYWRNTVKKNGQFKRGTFKRDSTRKYSVRVLDNLWLNKNYKKKIFKAIKKSPLNEEPGFVYSGLLFYLLPDIVADLTEENFESYIKENIYRPLGAYSITYNAYKHYPLKRIVPTERDTFFRMAQLHGTVHDEGAAMMGGVSSNAGLFGTADDLAKLFQMYMNYGRFGGEQVIPAFAVKEFTRCQYCQQDNHRGLGFDKPQPFNPDGRYTALSASPDSFGHSGYTGTFVWADPQAELVVIFFSNRVYPTRDNRKLYQMDIRPRLHQVIYDAIMDKTTR
jgi:CubicO group peptidase (beta-lactamase class C family)